MTIQISQYTKTGNLELTHKVEQALKSHFENLKLIKNEPLPQIFQKPDLQITILCNHNDANQSFVDDWLYCQKTGIASLLFVEQDRWVPNKFKNILVNYTHENFQKGLEDLISNIKTMKIDEKEDLKPKSIKFFNKIFNTFIA